MGFGLRRRLLMQVARDSSDGVPSAYAISVGGGGSMLARKKLSIFLGVQASLIAIGLLAGCVVTSSPTGSGGSGGSSGVTTATAATTTTGGRRRAAEAAALVAAG
jgi:hypothetical protein